MKVTETMMKKPSDMVLLSDNPRKITKADMQRLVDSIRINGFWLHRPLAVEQGSDGKFVVLCGNQRLKAAKKLKLKEIPVVVYSDLTKDERADLILRDNINNGDWDSDVLLDSDTFSDVDLDFIGLDLSIDSEEEKDGSEDRSVPNQDKDDGEEESEDGDDGENLVETDNSSFYRSMLGDFLYDSDNRFEIPNLLIDQQPKHVELPFTPWGANSRLRKDVNTYHFYVDDYRFEALFKDPIKLLDSGCKQIVEPNCSCHDQTPIAMGIYQIYRKRYLARYFQECGVKVWVDLNVSHRFIEYNKMGIPKGYNAFFTRGLDGWMESLKLDLQVAQEISGLERPNLCVYGGGEEIQEFCASHGLLYLADFINAKKK